MKPTPKSPLPESPLLLAFGAHPDDIEFGCGGVIARETQAGHKAHFIVCSRGEAGTHGTPAFFIATLALTLSPIRRIVSALGPMKTKPLFSTRSAKSAFSARNPYPG